MLQYFQRGRTQDISLKNLSQSYINLFVPSLNLCDVQFLQLPGWLAHTRPTEVYPEVNAQSARFRLPDRFPANGWKDHSHLVELPRLLGARLYTNSYVCTIILM